MMFPLLFSVGINLHSLTQLANLAVPLPTVPPHQSIRKRAERVGCLAVLIV